jgi:hypothetical protein
MLWICRWRVLILLYHLFYLMAPYFGEMSLIFSNVLTFKFPSPYRAPLLLYPDHTLDLVIACLVGKIGFGWPLYNPSQPKLTLFCQVLVSMIASSHPPFVLPLMEPSVPLGAVIIFCIRWPNSHFVHSKRNRGLRTNTPRTYVVGKQDLDNLVKFALDAIGGVIYVTDSQICHISCRKVWDEGQG